MSPKESIILNTLLLFNVTKLTYVSFTLMEIKLKSDSKSFLYFLLLKQDITVSYGGKIFDLYFLMFILQN